MTFCLQFFNRHVFDSYLKTEDTDEITHTDKYNEILNCGFQCLALISIFLYKPFSRNLLDHISFQAMHLSCTRLHLIPDHPLAMTPDGMSHQCHTTGPLGSFGQYALPSLGDTQTPEACVYFF